MMLHFSLRSSAFFLLVGWAGWGCYPMVAGVMFSGDSWLPFATYLSSNAGNARLSEEGIVANARHATSCQIPIQACDCRLQKKSKKRPDFIQACDCKLQTKKTALFKLSSMRPNAFFCPSHCLSHHSTQFSASFNAAGCKSQGLQDMQITACKT